MGTAFGIVGMLLLLGGLVGALIGSSAVGQVQSSITFLAGIALVIAAVLVDLLKNIRDRLPPRRDG